MNAMIVKPDCHISFFHMGRVRLSKLTVSAPEFMRGLRAVFVSDVHLRRSEPEARLDALMEQIRQAEPHILLLGGDYGEGVDQQERFFRALAATPLPLLGRWGVLGNNDREFFQEPGKLRAIMAEAGARLLINEWEALPLEGGGTLAIGGTDEKRHGTIRENRLFAGCAPGAYRVMLSHYPFWPRVRADLILSGHTHGGQLNFLGLNPFTVGFEERYPIIKDSAEKDGATLLVSRGIGYSRLPLRVGAYPEIHLIEFGG